ncbi:hypothetical protein EVAR_28771_1 [Eumeta japonica]|uniref:Uncharacterized protein n=1 Tax=Eumeta variegata TaxID=151549 RepID=A0A4C1VFW7_EUMVA|nr:hypothetical protein EVAR_28771_1 [Eumeta japonica]
MRIEVSASLAPVLIKEGEIDTIPLASSSCSVAWGAQMAARAHAILIRTQAQADAVKTSIHKQIALAIILVVLREILIKKKCNVVRDSLQLQHAKKLSAYRSRLFQRPLTSTDSVSLCRLISLSVFVLILAASFASLLKFVSVLA